MTLLEENQRLSASRLWALQRRFFATQGQRAWSEHIVPHYVSCNPFLARSYARLVASFLRDLWPEIDPREPVHILDLGAGSGRLGFHFLRQAGECLGLPRLRDVRLRYVMADLFPEQIEELRRRPAFAPWIESGQLDFACFDAESPEPPRLLLNGAVLDESLLRNPLVVIANYFFDSIPQDLFLISDGELQEIRVTLTSSQEETDLDDPAILSRLRMDCHPAQAAAAGYSGDPALDRLLDEYRTLPGRTHLLFPIAGLRCLQLLRRIAHDRLLLLSADKGMVFEEELLGLAPPGISVHGSISMPVSYHAFGQLFRNEGGAAFFVQRRRPSFRICAFVAGRTEEELPETRQMFREAVEEQGADDFFQIKKSMEHAYAALSLEQILSFLRFSRWDAQIFWGAFERLMALARSADEAGRRQLSRAVREVWEMYLPIGEERDLAFDLAMLLASIDELPEALELFGHSLRLQGPDATTFFNMAVCHVRSRQLPSALEATEKALELDPGHPDARVLRIRLRADLGR